MIDTYVNFDIMVHTFMQAGDGEDNNFLNMVISLQDPGARDIHVEHRRKILKVIKTKQPMTYLFSNELKKGMKVCGMFCFSFLLPLPLLHWTKADIIYSLC